MKPITSISCPSEPVVGLVLDNAWAAKAIHYRVTPQNVSHFSNVLSKFNIGDDCPVFDGMYDYFRQYAGASIAAGRKLASGHTDIAVNWTGGLHHAKKLEASGFCYINDIVLAILELLKWVIRKHRLTILKTYCPVSQSPPKSAVY